MEQTEIGVDGDRYVRSTQFQIGIVEVGKALGEEVPVLPRAVLVVLVR